MNYPKRVKIVELESAPFQCAKDAIVYAKSHGIDGKRCKGNAVNDRVTIAVLYGCVSMGGLPFRAKTTLKLHKDVSQPTKAYSYEISNIEVLRGNAECAIQPSNNTPTFDVDILLKDVLDVNGVQLVRIKRRRA